MEPPAFGPGRSQPLPSPAWEGLRAFLQPLVGPPRLPTLLAVDLLSSLGHSCCNSRPPPHPPAEVGPGKQVHSRPAASQDFAGNTTGLSWSRCSVAAACRPSLMHILYRLQDCTHLLHGVPTSHPEWDAAPPVGQVMKHQEPRKGVLKGPPSSEWREGTTSPVPLTLSQAAPAPSTSLRRQPLLLH